METTNIWHPLADGKMHHYFQVTENGIRKYYTDGELILTAKVNSDGTITALRQGT